MGWSSDWLPERARAAASARRREDAHRRKRRQWGAFRGAAGYEARIGELARSVDLDIVRSYLAGAEGTLVDLPCGAGRMSRALEDERHLRVVSADYSLGMLAESRRRGSSRLLRCDAFAMPFGTGSIARLLMLRLAFHYADPLPIVREAARVLRPGGELIFDTLNSGSTRHAAEWLLRLAGRRRRDVGLSFLAPAAVGATLARAGLAIVESRSRFLLPTRLYRFLPAWLHGPLVSAERLVPSRFLVLSFWRAAKPA